MGSNEEPLTKETARAASERFLLTIPPYPGTYHGRGIVICAGGAKFFTSAWIGIRLLRTLGCTLPIQIWYLGEGEMNAAMRALVEPLGVECIDAAALREIHPARILRGWELKPYALMHCPFREVLLLDADNLATTNPQFLFGTPQFQETGALFWPDTRRTKPSSAVWDIFGVSYQDEPEFDSGQIVLDKERVWRPLSLCLWYNEHSDFYYQHVYGDKETFHFAFRKLGAPYALPTKAADRIENILFQYDLDDNLLFQHGKKWDYFDTKDASELVFAAECWSYLEELRQLWDGVVPTVRRFGSSTASDRRKNIAQTLIRSVFNYERVGYDRRPIVLCPDGTIGTGWGEREVFWDLAEEDGEISLDISSETELTCRLKPDGEGRWAGRWLHREQMPITLSPSLVEMAKDDEAYISTFLPASGRRAALTAALLRLQGVEAPVIVEIGSLRDSRVRSRQDDGWSTVCFGWYAATLGAEFHTVDVSDFHSRVCRRTTRSYQEVIHYHVADGHRFLQDFDKPITLLYLDAWERDEGGSEADYLETYLHFKHKPALLLIDDVTKTADPHLGALPRLDSAFLAQMFRDGYRVASHEDGLVCMVREERSHCRLYKPSFEHMFTRPYRARVVSHSYGHFKALSGANVLIYWPHGFGDFVFLSHLLPLLESSNRYWIVRFGDDQTSLFEDNAWVTPVYLGHGSPLCADGGAFHNKHFGIDYTSIDGSVKTLNLPLSLYRHCSDHQIDTIFWSVFPELHGATPFPYHTKARNLLLHLVAEDRLKGTDLSRPLRSSLSFDVTPWLLQWVETRLRNRGGFGERKLCLIARSGYTWLSKNWGHLWREDLPPGKQREGEECRDFMRLLLKKDPRWMFLIMEDKLTEGEHTVRSEELHAYSFAELFGAIHASSPPFGLVMKALASLASLSIGVPTGPYHLCMAKPDLPTVGIWTRHLPSWYDEPKEASIHLISRNLRDLKLHLGPGSFDAAADLRYRTRWLDTRIVPGEQVLDAVEELLYH